MTPFVARNLFGITIAATVVAVVYFTFAAFYGNVAPDRYTATDAAEDLAVIERQIEALQKGVVEQ